MRGIPKRPDVGNLTLGIVLALAFNLFSVAFVGSLGVLMGILVLGVVLLILSRTLRNRLLQVFALSTAAVSLAILAFFLFSNGIDREAQVRTPIERHSR